MFQDTKCFGIYKRCLAAVLMICLCLVPALSLADGGYAAVTGGSLNLRETANVSAKVLGQYPTGTWVLVLETGATWNKVQVGSKTGYMMSKYLTTGSGSTIETRYVRTNTGIGVNLRQAPAETGTLVASFQEGTQVDVLVKGIGWYKVKAGGQEGYMVSKYLSTSAGNSTAKYGVVYNPKNTQVLFLRESASLSAAILGQYKNFTPLTILQAGNTWFKVEIGGKTGYMMASYVKTTGVPFASTLKNPNGGSIVNFRTGPSQSTSIIASYPVGTAVTVLDKGSNWTLVQINGATGYVSTYFLTF